MHQYRTMQRRYLKDIYKRSGESFTFSMAPDSKIRDDMNLVCCINRHSFCWVTVNAAYHCHVEQLISAA